MSWNKIVPPSFQGEKKQGISSSEINSTTSFELHLVQECLAAKQFAAAIALASEVIKKIPSCLDAYRYRAQAYEKLEQHANALREYETILSLQHEQLASTRVLDESIANIIRCVIYTNSVSLL